MHQHNQNLKTFLNESDNSDWIEYIIIVEKNAYTHLRIMIKQHCGNVLKNIFKKAFSFVESVPHTHNDWNNFHPYVSVMSQSKTMVQYSFFILRVQFQHMRSDLLNKVKSTFFLCGIETTGGIAVALLPPMWNRLYPPSTQTLFSGVFERKNLPNIHL